MAEEEPDDDIKLENRWRERVTQATKYHEEYFGRKIEEIAEYDRGEHWHGEADPSSSFEHITVNLVWANRRVVVPQVFYSRPEVSVTPLTDRLELHDEQGAPLRDERGQPVLHDVVKASEIAKPVIEQKLDQMRWKWQIRACVRDAYLFGMAICKIGYGSQFGKLANVPLADKEKPTGIADIRTPITGWSSSVHPNQPWTLRCHPRDIILPPETRTHDELPWVGHKIRRRVEDVQSDSRYDKDARDKVSGAPFDSSTGNQQWLEDHERSRYVQDEYCEIVEVHYRDAAQPKKYEMDRGLEEGATVYRILVYADGAEGLLMHSLDGIAMDIGHLPFQFLIYAEDTDRPYPQSDIGQVLPLNRELNKLHSYNLEMVKRQSPCVLYSSETFSDPEKEEQFLRGEPMRAIKTNNPQGVVVPQMPSISQDQYAVGTQMEQNFRKVGGVGENQMGQSSGGTATEANLVQQGVNIRIQDMLEITRDFAVRTIEDIFVLVSQRTSEQEIVRIEGPKGAEWRKWTGSDIRGPYRFSIDLTQMQPPNSAVRKKMVIDFLNLASTPPLQPHFNMPKLIKQVVKAFEDVFPNTDELLKQTDEPRQESELLAMMNGQQANVTPDQHHAEHRQVLAMFMQSPAFKMFPPEIQQLIMQHDQLHALNEQQLYGGGGGNAAPKKMGSPMEGSGAIPAMMGNKAPTESSLMAGAAGGRSPGAV